MKHALGMVVPALLVLTGCSLVIDTDQYRGGGIDGGAGDARPNGDAGDGGSDADGMVVNGPPVLQTVGLSTYRPMLGEMVRAFPGPVRDPDGDPTTLHYQWFAGETAIAGATGATVTIDPAILAAGTLRLDAWASDAGGDGPTVTVGPVDVIDSRVTRWRALLPHRDLETLPVIAYDARHHRIVMLSELDGSVWEYALDEGEERWAKLFPGRPPGPLVAAASVYEPASSRLVVFGGIAGTGVTSRVVELDLRTRGAEEWRELTPGGTAPPARMFAGATAGPGGKVFFYGGRTSFSDTEESFLDDLWELDLSTRGSESWRQIPVTGPAVFVPALVAHPTEPVLYVLGGAGFSTTGDFTPSAAVHRVDLTPGSETIETLGATLPDPVLAPLALVDPDRDRAVVAFGTTAGGSSDAMAALSFATEAITPITASGTPPTNVGFGVFGRDVDGAMGWAVPIENEGGSFNVWSYDLATDTWTPILRNGVDLPPSLADMIAVSVGTGIGMWGGRTRGGEPTDTLWMLDETGWEIRETMPDAVTGNAPAPRWGIWMSGNSGFGAPIAFAGGSTGPGVFADMTAWELMDTRWVERTLVSSSPAPFLRTDAAYFQPACGARQLGMFGGAGSTGFLSDTWYLDCPTGDRLRDCTWVDAVGTLARPSPRRGARALHTGEEILLFGGLTATGASNEVFTFNPCAGGATPWTRMTVAGPAPPGRSGHTITHLTPRASGAEPMHFLIIGGVGSSGSGMSDVARLTRLSATTFTWEPVVPVPDSEVFPGRAYHLAVMVAGLVPRVLVYGGTVESEEVGDLWELRLAPP